MAALGLRALERIRTIEDGEDPFDKRSFASPDESPRDRGYRQLGLADEAITGLLKGEIELTNRLAALAPRFEIEAIDVLPSRADFGPVVGRGDQLLSAQRREGILAFLQVWGEAVDATRGALSDDADG